MLEVKYYLIHVLILILWVFSLHKQSVKTFYQCAKVDLIISCNDWNMIRYANWRVMITISRYDWNNRKKRSNGSGEDCFWILLIYFCYLVIITPLKRTWPFILTNLNFTEGWLVQSWVEIGRFCQFILFAIQLVIISPWKMAWPFIYRNLNPLHQIILCVKFGLNRPSCSGEEYF